MSKGIYYIRNKKNGKGYIGKDSHIDKRSRWKQHCRGASIKKGITSLIEQSIKKYGKDNFEYIILEEFKDGSILDSREYLNILEKCYIAKLKTNVIDFKDNGYNLTDGGDGGNEIDNTNENHGMWRHDIDNELIKNLYLNGMTTIEIEEYFKEMGQKVSRRTIDRRLNKILGSDELKRIGGERRKKSLKEYYNQDLPTDKIKESFLNGYNLGELSRTYGYSKHRIKKELISTLGEEKTKEIIKRNFKSNNNIPNGDILLKELKQGLTQKELAKKYKTTQKTIKNKILKVASEEEIITYKLKLDKRKKDLPSPQQLFKELKQGLTQKELAKKYKTTQKTIKNQLESYTNKEELDKIYKLNNPITKNIPLEILFEEWKNGASQVELAKKYNCTQSTISDKILTYVSLNNINYEKIKQERYTLFGYNKTSNRNTTGFFRVIKHKRSNGKFSWEYRYKENNKQKCIASKDLLKLEEKVKSQGLRWSIEDIERAKKSIKLNDEEKNKLPPSKYLFWHQSKVHYDKGHMLKYGKNLNPCTCFYAKYNGKKIKCGGFKEFISPIIIHNLITNYSDNSNSQVLTNKEEK